MIIQKEFLSEVKSNITKNPFEALIDVKSTSFHLK